MSARYGSRTRSGEAVSDSGRRGGAGGGTTEVTFTASPAPAVNTSTVTIGTTEFIVADVLASTTLTFAGTPATATAEVFIVAGGGAGGSSYNPTGGGGGGGVIEDYVPITATSYPIVIGAGGSAVPSYPGIGGNGNNTTGFSLTAIGGGGGGAYNSSGNPGGSGGGAAKQSSPLGVTVGGSGTTNQGHQGGWAIKDVTPDVGNTAGGGGGAGGEGQGTTRLVPGRNHAGGGYGRLTKIKGSYAYYGGGGGGGGWWGDSGPGGAGGGGSGVILSSGPGTGNSGQQYTGGGGGGTANTWPAGAFSGTGGAGGSGRLIVRFKRFQA